MNSYTQSLLIKIEDTVLSCFGSNELMAAFSKFKSIVAEEPSRPLQRFLFPNGIKEGMRDISVKQLQLLTMGVAFRATSTYSTIPKLVLYLQALGRYRCAGVLNENIRDEIGGRNYPSSHAEYLYQSFDVVGKAAGFNPLTPSGFLRLQTLFVSSHASEAVDFGDENNDETVARDFLNLADKRISAYHDLIVARLVVPAINKNDVLMHSLELALREASSVDEPNCPSFIGLYAMVIECFLDGLPQSENDRATIWSDSHNGTNGDDDKSLEELHAIDACDIAIQLLKESTLEQSLSALDEVSRFAQARHAHWSYVSRAMQATDSKA